MTPIMVFCSDPIYTYFAENYGHHSCADEEVRMTRLQDIMVTQVDTVHIDDSAEATWEKMQLRGFRHLVVVDGRKIVGVVSERDLGGPHGVSLRKNRSVSEFCSSPVVYGAPQMTLRKAANLMRGNTIGCLPVIDDHKRVVGIVTIADLLNLLGRGIEKPTAKSRRWTLRHRSHTGKSIQRPAR